MLLDVSQVQGFIIIPTDKQDVGIGISIHPSYNTYPARISNLSFDS